MNQNIINEPATEVLYVALFFQKVKSMAAWSVACLEVYLCAAAGIRQGYGLSVNGVEGLDANVIGVVVKGAVAAGTLLSPTK